MEIGEIINENSKFRKFKIDLIVWKYVDNIFVKYANSSV